jgi:N-acetylmuramoyl-L-alanine amidase
MKLSKTIPTAPRLAETEKIFESTFRDVSGKTWSPKASDFGNNCIHLTSNDTSFFYNEKHKKTSIVLHHTVGLLPGDIATLSKKNNHVSTAFVIGTSGKIYQLFDPALWSYHIGKTPSGALWTNTQLSRSTIAIELSNFGPLTRVENSLFDIYGFLYCSISDKEYYTELPVEWRGYKYFASYSVEQYKALDSLLLKLCRQFNIPHTFLPPDKRFSFSKTPPSVGIWAHCNVRSDKSDISMAFDFSRISGR